MTKFNQILYILLIIVGIGVILISLKLQYEYKNNFKHDKGIVFECNKYVLQSLNKTYCETNMTVLENNYTLNIKTDTESIYISYLTPIE